MFWLEMHIKFYKLHAWGMLLLDGFWSSYTRHIFFLRIIVQVTYIDLFQRIWLKVHSLAMNVEISWVLQKFPPSVFQFCLFILQMSQIECFWIKEWHLNSMWLMNVYKILLGLCMVEQQLLYSIFPQCWVFCRVLWTSTNSWLMKMYITTI